MEKSLFNPKSVVRACLDFALKRQKTASNLNKYKKNGLMTDLG